MWKGLTNKYHVIYTNQKCEKDWQIIIMWGILTKMWQRLPTLDGLTESKDKNHEYITNFEYKEPQYK